MAVTVQPRTYAASEFQTGLYSCCDDCGTLFFALCCFPCLVSSVASDMGECGKCGSDSVIRSVYRTKYNIKGSMCKDWCAYTFCFACAVCQLKRDIKMRKMQGIFF